MSEICLCVHCSTQLSGSGKYCPDCNTAEKRKAMDGVNKKLFEENKLSPYNCEVCNPPQSDAKV